ncbi:MAG: hypothetical protein CFH19_00270 [Alphaproteobacteria bacterium MarineAlpha5_Bin9]|nr:MAG: hypothetical protein CFH19_00270 [Alphaproteobacteria bacterium MarineAlpha5_Bin9]|tara:strand:+ start:3347 stop:4018 length:672 start_codon:yes stop_codon:yes gene_type:complete
MNKHLSQIDTWLFDLDNTLYPADSGIFQQVHVLMGKFISKRLGLKIEEAKKIQKEYFRKHGTTLRGLMDNHGIDPDEFLDEVHNLDYSIVKPNPELRNSLTKLNGKKIIFTNANLAHAEKVLSKLKIKDLFEDIYDIKLANYIPKPEMEPYKDVIKKYNVVPRKTVMLDDIAKNLVPASKLGITTVWIDMGYENFSDDIENSKKYLNYQITNLPLWLNSIIKE